MTWDFARDLLDLIFVEPRERAYRRLRAEELQAEAMRELVEQRRKLIDE